jgi:hypothetical protein
MPTYSESGAHKRKSEDAAIFIKTNMLTATYIAGCALFSVRASWTRTQLLEDALDPLLTLKTQANLQWSSSESELEVLQSEEATPITVPSN